MAAKLVHTDSNHPSMKPQFAGDSPSGQATVHSTASGDVLHSSKNTSALRVPEISVCDEAETCIPSPTALLDQRDITSSLATEVAQCHFHSSLTLAYGVGYKHPLQHDVKSHPSDKVELDIPRLSVSSVLPKGPFSVDKVA